MNELQHILTKLVTGFKSCIAREYYHIHTGNFGCGVFYNSFDVVYLLQVLAAWIVGVEELHFWGHKDIKETPEIKAIKNLFSNRSKLSFDKRFEKRMDILKISYSLNDQLHPILIGNENKWMVLNDNNKWQLYDDKNQFKLNENDGYIGIKHITLSLSGLLYYVEYRKYGWIQYQFDENNNVLIRKVLPPTDFKLHLDEASGKIYYTLYNVWVHSCIISK